MKIAQEFRQFIARGNVVDLAVGVIIGAAFGKIVNALVNDMIMPSIGALMNGVNFSSLFFSLDGVKYASLQEAIAKGAPVIGYGAFINTIVEFFIVAACVFALVKVVNRIHTQKPAGPAAPTKTELLLADILEEMRKSPPVVPARPPLVPGGDN